MSGSRLDQEGAARAAWHKNAQLIVAKNEEGRPLPI